MKSKYLCLLFIVISLCFCSCGSTHSNNTFPIPGVNKMIPIGKFSNYNTYASTGFLKGPDNATTYSANSMVLDKNDNSLIYVYLWAKTIGGIHRLARVVTSSQSFNTWVMPDGSNTFIDKHPLVSPVINKNSQCGLGFCNISGQSIAYDPGNHSVVFFDCTGGPDGSTWGWNGTNWSELGVQPIQLQTQKMCTSYISPFPPSLFTYENTVGALTVSSLTHPEIKGHHIVKFSYDVWIYDNQTNIWSILTTINQTGYYQITSIAWLPLQSELILVEFPVLNISGFTTLIYKN